MFDNFFNRLYYGDPRKPDLKKEDMPDTSFKTFFTVLRIRFWKLIQLNLLHSIFMIPGFLISILYLYAYYENYVKTPNPMDPSFFFLYFLLIIPCLIFAGPATAGTTYVLRNWARDEHAWLWSDFVDAFKKNWKPSLLIMLINGFTLLLFYLDTIIYAEMAEKSFLYMIFNYFILGGALLYAMMNMYIFPMLVTYKLNIKQIFKNAFIFTVVELPRTFLIFALTIGLFIAIFYLGFSTAFIPIFLVGFTFPMLIMISYTNWVFMKYFHGKRKQKKVNN